MKTSAQIADGFARQDRKRAHCVRELAYKEGAAAILGIIEGMLSVPDLSDEEIIHGITLWIKEMKENASEEG
jgi:hypothetical protein